MSVTDIIADKKRTREMGLAARKKVEQEFSVKMKNCPYCKAPGNLYFNPQVSQITPVPSAGATLVKYASLSF